jgi:hypothetical protein
MNWEKYKHYSWIPDTSTLASQSIRLQEQMRAGLFREGGLGDDEWFVIPEPKVSA